jgi:hypothetical protein
MNKFTLRLTIILFLLSFSGQGLAWHDNTHLAVAKVTGYKMWYNAAAPDVAKLKADNKEAYNHWYNNNRKEEITAQIVFDQAERYNKMCECVDSEGHLYGAIIGSLRDYEKDSKSGKYGEYNLVYCEHYIGDLSMPFHNIPNDDFNKSRHAINDGIVDETVLNQLQKIEKHMYTIKLSNDHFEADLAREIARIANLSRQLGYRLSNEKRDMTPDEAYVQLGHSASLLKAVLQHYKKI